LPKVHFARANLYLSHGRNLMPFFFVELAYRIPHRICSLVLGVTRPGGFVLYNFPPLKGFFFLIKSLITLDPHKRISSTLDMLFPKKWLAERAKTDPLAEMNGNTKGNEQGKTNYQVQKEDILYRFSINKPQLIWGHLSQLIAGFTHNVSPERLAFIAANIPKIAIVTGDNDVLIDPSGSESIKVAMDKAIINGDQGDVKRVEFLKWEGRHAIHIQNETEFNQLIERCAKEGKTLIENSWTGRKI